MNGKTMDLIKLQKRLIPIETITLLVKRLKKNRKRIYNSANLVVGRVTFLSSIWANLGILEPANLNDFKYDFGINYPEFYYLKSSEEKTYYDNKVGSVKTNHSYDNKTGYIKETSTLNSLGDQLKKKYIYPSTGRLVKENRINGPIQVNQFKNSTPISHVATNYQMFGSNYLPQTLSSSKGNKALEEEIIYHKYDNYGNVEEMSINGCAKLFYVWGYHKAALLAKIENYQILSAYQRTIISNIITQSNSEFSQATENSLRTALSILRSSFTGTNAQLTTYTYDPLIGITSITDPRGETFDYVYDNLNRLQLVKDNNGNILKTYEYHLTRNTGLSIGRTGNTNSINNTGTTTTTTIVNGVINNIYNMKTHRKNYIQGLLIGISILIIQPMIGQIIQQDNILMSNHVS